MDAEHEDYEIGWPEGEGVVQQITLGHALVLLRVVLTEILCIFREYLSEGIVRAATKAVWHLSARDQAMAWFEDDDDEGETWYEVTDQGYRALTQDEHKNLFPSEHEDDEDDDEDDD